MIARLQAYFEERTRALISVLSSEIDGMALIGAWALKGMNMVPGFKAIYVFWLKRRFFKSFYHIWAWRPSWS